MKTVLATALAQKQIQILCAPRIEANIWVRLVQQPFPYDFNEALLLCQVSFDEWLAWIPEYGETCLNINEFECME